MFGLMFHFPTQAELNARRERKLQRMANAEPWSEDMAWKRELNLKADTYQVIRFFGGERTESPNGKWLYEERHLDKGGMLATHQGSRLGSVVFDGPVIIPALFQQNDHSFPGWGPSPFMSLTPMEFFTLRSGTRLAKGHTVIAGLGMGHQLINVAKKKSVKRITVVEKSGELVRFIWPEIQKHLPDKPVEMIVGDAYEVLPTLTADIALVDIFPNYGGNKFEAYRKGIGYGRVLCPGIKRMWVWGSAEVRGSNE
jgi:hypothetical protein